MSARCLAYCCRASIIALVVITLLVVGTGGSVVMGNASIKIGYHGSSLSIDVQEARVSEIFKELAKKTPYEFIVPEELLQNRTTLKCSGVDLGDGVRRIVNNTGVDNYAVVYSFREASSNGGSWCQVRVVLMDRDISGKDQRYADFTDRERDSEVIPEQERQLVSLPSDMVPIAQEVNIIPKQFDSAYVLQQVAPKGVEIAAKEVLTPVVISPEAEGFPVYQRLECDQNLTRLQPPDSSSN